VFDALPRVAAKDVLDSTRIVGIVVSTKSAKLGRGARLYYEKFARMKISSPGASTGNAPIRLLRQPALRLAIAKRTGDIGSWL